MNSKSTASHKSSTSFSLDDFAKALDSYDYQFEQGKIVLGKAYEYTSEGAYVDIGGKSPGFLPAKEASIRSNDDLASAIPLQEEIEFIIIKGQDAEGQVTLSRRQLELKQAWENIATIADTGKSVQVFITGVNKGGVIGEIEGLRGFIPRSHLVNSEDLDSLIGQSLTANFIEVDPENKKLVLSQRDAIRAVAIGKMAKGDLMEGKISSIKPYGVFVDLNGVGGLLHIKEISNAQVPSLTTVFTVGQRIKVVLSEVDDFKNRLSLSTKVLEAYPGEILEKIDEVMDNAEERWEKAKQEA
jgi:small subunit ribosomal protein S1